MRDSHRINLRLPLEEFQEIDHLREQEPVKVSRNIWIAMAIREKLERDSKRLEGSHA
jgi:metal-responsive CopG/Arc/MetJ family transcriptional regulator